MVTLKISFSKTFFNFLKSASNISFLATNIYVPVGILSEYKRNRALSLLLALFLLTAFPIFLLETKPTFLSLVFL
nr:hypothetical protein [Nitrosophilus kaiyonis]